jgi:hypothetical protein
MSTTDRQRRENVWRRRLLVGCEVTLAHLAGEPERQLVRLRADISGLRDRIAAELDGSADGRAMAGREITVLVDENEGGIVAASDLECVLVSLGGALNVTTIDAIGSALDYAINNAHPELALTGSQAISLFAEIRHAHHDTRLAPVGSALKTALNA